MLAITSDQVKRFLDAASENKHFILFCLLIETGLRPSECLGLLRSDIDIAAGTLTVQRTLIWKRDGASYYFGTTKKKQSRRSIPLSPQMLELLRHHLAKQGAARLRAGKEYKDQGLLFAGDNGQPFREHNLIVRHFKPILEKGNLSKKIRMYDLRHSCATILLENGEHPKVVAERLGHSSVILTLDVYSHVRQTCRRARQTKSPQQCSAVAESHTRVTQRGNNENWLTILST